MGVRLPSAYQEVEWIGTSGTQIIDTDYLPIDGDEMSFDFEFSAFPPYKSYACLMATDNSDPQYQMVFGIDSNERTLYYKYFSSGAAMATHIPFIVGTRYRADIVANGTLSIGDYTVTPVNNLGYATGHLRFFARMAGNINFYGRLYKFVASHGGAEKVNLVPCYLKSDSEAGLYDLISGVFYTNTGIGEFLVGPNVIDSISPWLVARRRMLMKEPEHWDLVLKAQADGTIPAVNATSTYGISWSRGQTLTIAWDATGYDANTTRIMLYTNNAGPIVYEYQLTDTIGQMSFYFNDYATTASTRNVLLSRNWQDRTGPRFKGNYIKIRIT